MRHDPLVNVLGPLDGAALRGGCDHCDAYQSVSVMSAGVYRIDVLHDAGCPLIGKRDEA